MPRATPFAATSSSSTSCPKGYTLVGQNCVKIPPVAKAGALAPAPTDVAKYLAQMRLKSIGKQVGAAFVPGRPAPRTRTKGVK